MKKVPVIIPARAGSKGIPNKNIIEICGKPLLAWSIIQALTSECVSNVYVSTDGSQIGKVTEAYGGRVIERPDCLSGDTATSESALLHAISVIEEYEDFDDVFFLQATSPLRKKHDIDAAYKQYKEGKYDSLFSMAVMDDFTLWQQDKKGEIASLSYDYTNRGRRQDREPVYLENGSIYIFKKELLKSSNNRLGGKIGMYKMPFIHSFEIDSDVEIEICEYFLNKIIMEDGI